MSKLERTPISILVISDGRPGHYHLSDGIVAAIARRRPVKIRRLEVRRPKWAPPRLLSALIKRGVNPHKILKRIYGVGTLQIEPVDLIVSAGGDTLAANVAVKKLLGDVPNIFYGSLRRYAANNFTLSMTSDARLSARPQILALMPSSLNTTPPSRPRFSQEIHGLDQGHPKIAGLVIGGNTRDIKYKRQDWSELFEYMRQCHARFGTRWIISNGPRTAAGVSNRMNKVANDPRYGVDRFIDIKYHGPGTLNLVLSQVDAVFSTADSNSVISQAIWAKRPCISLMPKNARLPDKERSYQNWLQQNRWCREMSIAGLTPEATVAQLTEIQPMNDDPAIKLAELIDRYIPELLQLHQRA